MGKRVIFFENDFSQAVMLLREVQLRVSNSFYSVSIPLTNNPIRMDFDGRLHLCSWIAAPTHEYCLLYPTFPSKACDFYEIRSLVSSHRAQNKAFDLCGGRQ